MSKPNFIKWDLDTPIMIPSLKRYMKNKTPKLMLDSCIEDIYKHYNATSIHVLAQEYSNEDQEFLNAKFPNVDFKWEPKRLGIINTFEALKTWGASLGDRYFHYDDDVKMTQIFSHNPSLLAMNSLMDMAPNRVGIVTLPSISIHHFSKKIKRFIQLWSNPAQLVLINSKPANHCHYDAQFPNFRSDTDFTMQMSSQNYIPLMIMRHFSFMHSVPMSTINKTGDMKKRFIGMDNVTKSAGSLGGNRSWNNRVREYDAFKKKWPETITHKNYRQQVFKKSTKKLTNFVEQELLDFEANFNYADYVHDWDIPYYGDQVEMIHMT